jgi:hypothetical protein
VGDNLCAHADLAELPGDGLVDLFIFQIAAIRRVQGEGDSLREAGL